MISEERMRELACEACDWRALSRAVEAEARRDERQRIARWVHDMVAQHGNAISGGWIADQIKRNAP